MKLSNLIGKQIYSIYETQEVGTTSQALFNASYTKVLGFYFFDNEEEEHYIKYNNIYAFGDVFAIKNILQIASEFPIDEMPSPLNKKIIDLGGNFLGNLSDLNIDEKGNIVSYISSLGKEISISDICANKDFILCGENIKLASFRPREKREPKTESLQNIKVSIMRMEEPMPKIQYMPPKITVLPESFIGKVVKEDLFGQNNELLLKKNQNITQKALELIKKHNRVNQLYHICY